ncbi:MAG: hypothetical protein RLZZ176_633 [Cyanobacteriota bacterium]|jgi:hypothetical protein
MGDLIDLLMVQMYYNTWVKILDLLEILKLETEAIIALIPVSIILYYQQ